MPVRTMASAISRTIASVTWPWNLFQLFQPMGGVLASPLFFTGAGMSTFTMGARAGSGSGLTVETRINSNTCGGRGGGGGPAAAGPRPGPRPPQAGTVNFQLTPSQPGPY